MSDDLVKRLRNTPNWMREGFRDWKDNVRTYDRAPFEAADRVEELEAKLAKAVEALGGMVGLFSGYSLLLKGMHLKVVLYNARAALAELKGQ